METNKNNLTMYFVESRIKYNTIVSYCKICGKKAWDGKRFENLFGISKFVSYLVLKLFFVIDEFQRKVVEMQCKNIVTMLLIVR